MRIQTPIFRVCLHETIDIRFLPEKAEFVQNQVLLISTK